MNEMFRFLKNADNSRFNSENIVFLLGAGASTDAGMPTLSQIMSSYETEQSEVLKNINQQLKTAIERRENVHPKSFEEQELTKDVNKYSSDRERLSLKRELYEYFKRRSASSSYSLSASANIENILAMMKDFLSMKKEGKIYNLIGNWDKELIDITKGNISEIEKLKDELQEFIVKKLNIDRDQPINLKYFDYIFSLQEQLGGVLKIFSLNQDCTVEEAYKDFYIKKKSKQPKMLLETGFNDTWDENNSNYDNDKMFKISNFEIDEKNEKQIHLYKLHGSINWERWEDEIKRREIGKITYSNNLDKELIFGVSQKFKFEEPYYSLYHNYRSTLENRLSKILVIIGYSFNDPHINGAISNALKENKDLRIIICDVALCETQFFSFPKISGVTGIKRNDHFLRNIIRSEDYEMYANISVLLYSLYYSRNYDEHSVFLAISSYEKCDFLANTIAGRNLKYSRKVLNEILSLRDYSKPYRKLKKYFTETDPQKNKQDRHERNKHIYDKMLELKGIGYEQVLETISKTKVRVYEYQNTLNIKYPIPGEGENNIKAVADLIDDLRMIEKFIKEFIPIHLCLMFALMKQHDDMREDDTGPEKMNLRISIYELYLKYNYLIDVIIIKIADKNKKDYKYIREILTPEYCDLFEEMIGNGNLKIKKNIKEINNFLKNIKNEFLRTPSIEGGWGYDKIISPIIDNKSEFEDAFLAWDMSKKRELKTRDPQEFSDLNEVLHKAQPYEKRMQVKAMLYTKSLAKSMVGRFNHAERLVQDTKILVEIIEGRDLSTFSDLLKKDMHYYRAGKPIKNHSGILKIIKDDEEKFGDRFSDPISDAEVKEKVKVNMNWYVNRYYSILKKFTKSLLAISFSDENGSFYKNIITYARLLNKENDLPPDFFTEGIEYLYREGGISNIEQIFKNDELNRITVNHFSASVFLSKDLRPYNLFRYYNSHFYMEEHIRSFGDVDRMLFSRISKKRPFFG